MPQLNGEAKADSVPHAVIGGVLRVRVIDVSRADAAATVIAEEAIPGVTLQSAGDRVGFLLNVPALDPHRTYALEVHLDADGSGEISAGDYRTMEHIPVTSATFGSTVMVRLRPIT